MLWVVETNLVIVRYRTQNNYLGHNERVKLYINNVMTNIQHSIKQILVFILIIIKSCTCRTVRSTEYLAWSSSLHLELSLLLNVYQCCSVCIWDLRTYLFADWMQRAAALIEVRVLLFFVKQ